MIFTVQDCSARQLCTSVERLKMGKLKRLHPKRKGKREGKSPLLSKEIKTQIILQGENHGPSCNLKTSDCPRHAVSKERKPDTRENRRTQDPG